MINDNNLGVNMVNDSVKKEKLANSIIGKLEKYINDVGPVDSLVKLVGSYRGNDIFDKIRDYIKCGGSELDFYLIYEEQTKKYYESKTTKNKKEPLVSDKIVDNILKGSVKTHGAIKYEAKRERKKVDKKLYNKLLLILLSVITTVVISMGAIFINDYLDRQNEFNESINKIETNYVLDIYDLNIEDNSKFNLNTLDNFNVDEFCSYLEENKFNEDEIIFVTYKLLGRDYANSVCLKYTNLTLDNFLNSKYFVPIMSSDSKTIIGKTPSFKVFENHVEEGIKAKANFIKYSK